MDPTVKSSIISTCIKSFQEDQLSTAYYLSSDDFKIPDHIPNPHIIAEKEEKIYSDSMALYDKFAAELDNKQLMTKYFTKYDGYVYKTDIFALGLTIQKLATKLSVYTPHLEDLVLRMTQFDPDSRPNINQCLAHPFFDKRNIVVIR
jgi:serine/threonine protein kinase